MNIIWSIISDVALMVETLDHPYEIFENLAPVVAENEYRNVFYLRFTRNKTFDNLLYGILFVNAVYQAPNR